jgi:hypothetical protein
MKKIDTLLKVAAILPAWGGQYKNFGDKDSNANGELGYNYVAGVIPMPYIGAKFRKAGFGLGISPVGLNISLGGIEHHDKFKGSNPRSLYKFIKDKLKKDNKNGK